jgi:hypothetical protein
MNAVKSDPNDIKENRADGIQSLTPNSVKCLFPFLLLSVLCAFTNTIGDRNIFQLEVPAMLYPTISWNAHFPP